MKRMRLGLGEIVSLLIWGIIFPCFVWAIEQNPSTTLEDVVVTATRTDKTLLETAASVTIITAEQIEEMGATNFVEIVENIPGVVKDSDSRERLTFRGNRSPQSGGVLVLINGVPANNGIGWYVEYDSIPVSDIERIEVRRSSGNIAFGPDASRGVINLITKRGKAETFSGKTSVSYGSWNSLKAFAGVSGQVNKWDYAFGGSFFNTDGYEDDNKELGTARVSVGHNFSKETRLGLNLDWHKADYDTIYGKTKWQLDNYRREKIFPTSETNDTLIHNRENEDENTAVSLEFSTKKEKFFANGLMSYDNTDHVYRYLAKKLDSGYSTTSSYYDYQEDSDQDRFLARASGGYNFLFNTIKYTPTIGADYEKISFDLVKSYPWSPTPLSASQESAVAKGTMDAERERFGIFLNNELDFSRQWELSFSGRFDQVDYDVSTLEPNQVTNSHSDFSWDITPAYHPTSNATVYASFSQSYWYPVLYYYKYAMEYATAEYTAQDLKPEKYQTLELGYKQYVSTKLSLAFTAYYMQVDDKFLSLYDSDATSDWLGYRNVGDSEHMGLELEASGQINPMVGYRLQGAYQNAEWDNAIFKPYIWGETSDSNTENVDISGQQVPHLPKFTGTFGLDFYFLSHWKFSADLNYYGKQYVDVLNRYEISDYVTADLKLTYTAEKFKVWVLCNNVFDREEYNYFNETGRRNSDGTPYKQYYYPMSGRYIEAGVSFDF
ncbi:TonB-dependent receptor [uncultured Desulfobacter sp.]|uniref:TonB-dependent receptor n=1 Tax=uncultured Desulfobacter sp. TaxID=240139 RepID=UPI0029F4C440|nr:TonB-dependent receptor [uncultured Desulfobacter sp.]